MIKKKKIGGIVKTKMAGAPNRASKNKKPKTPTITPKSAMHNMKDWANIKKHGSSIGPAK